MASGKSHVGRILSRRTGWPLVDTDDEIVRRAGQPVHQIFQDGGEGAFRTLERLVVSEQCAKTGQIIAAGGGAFVDSDSRRRMLESGLVFCLSAQPETILRRVSRATGKVSSFTEGSATPSPSEMSMGLGGEVLPAVRPLLAGANPLERIKALLSQRAEAYAQAHHTIETDFLTPEQVAESILRLTYLPPLSKRGTRTSPFRTGEHRFPPFAKGG